MKARIIEARELALKRQGAPNAYLTGESLREHTQLSAEPETFIKAVIKQFSLSGRGYDRLLRVARTIADLANEDALTEAHLAEAVSYRDTA